MDELRNISKPRKASLGFHPNPLAQWSGFTLLELLVVIAIIAILAALLLPALFRAKQKAQQIVCLTRIKQWDIAFKMYAEDNDGWIAREGFEKKGEVSMQNWASVKRDESKDVWYNVLPPYLSQQPASVYYSYPKRAFFLDTGLLIHCPSARFPGKPGPDALFSLAMNSQLIQPGRCDPVRVSIQFSLIERQDPSRLAIFLDERLKEETKIDPLQEDDGGQSAAWANRFSGRHYGGGNIVFGDGHAIWLPGTQVVETDPESPLRGGPILPPKEVVWEVY